MKNLLKKLMGLFAPEVRLVPIILPARRLESEELRNALANAVGTPTWDAVIQVLMDNYQTVQGVVSNPALTEQPGALAQAVGGQAWLGNAIVELQNRAKGARKELAQIAEAEARKQAKQ